MSQPSTMRPATTLTKEVDSRTLSLLYQLIYQVADHG